MGSDPKTALAAPLTMGELPAQSWPPCNRICGSGSASAYSPSGEFMSTVKEEREIATAELPSAAAEQSPNLSPGRKEGKKF